MNKGKEVVKNVTKKDEKKERRKEGRLWKKNSYSGV